SLQGIYLKLRHWRMRQLFIMEARLVLPSRCILLSRLFLDIIVMYFFISFLIEDRAGLAHGLIFGIFDRMCVSVLL
ncbi:hypothetical protein ACQWG3_25080, partial [Salmonella enterica subsp. enterica serovar Infantis]